MMFRISAASTCNFFPFVRELECFLHILDVNKFAISKKRIVNYVLKTHLVMYHKM